MTYGHFDDAALEYVITRPDTPRPWSNYLGSRRYGGVITNHGGGYSFTRSPAEGRLLRFRYNAIPADQPGRTFYLRDAEANMVWSAAWQPVGRPLDVYRSTCRFGTSYCVIDSDYLGIHCETTYFVPLDAAFEYWVLRVRNTGDQPRRLNVVSFCEFTNEWNLPNDLLNLQYSQYIGQAECLEPGLISVSSCARLPEDEGNFANRDQSRWWYLAQVGGDISGYDLDRDAFLGPYRGFDNPRSVERGACGNSAGFSDNLCGAVQSDLFLPPGAEETVIVMLGVGRAATVGVGVRAEYGTAERAEQELARLKEHWHSLIRRQSAETPDADFDHMVNVWNTYNALITYEWSRSCSLVYTGDSRDGFGYRDTVQDLLGVLPYLGDGVRDRLRLMLSAQDSTGGAQPEVRPWLHQPGSMAPTDPAHYRSDDCLWLFNVVPAYLAETGDLALLDEVVPYADQGQATVLGHLRRALEFNLERTGAHGLPCGLLADWNDCLKLGYRGESVFVAFQLRLGLASYACLAERLGRADEAAWAQAQRQQLDAAIAAVCWDGEWFIWAIGEDGTVFGTKDHPEGQVYLNTQAWAVISGAASPEQTELCLNTVRDRLATDYGVALCDPPFDTTPVAVMRAVLFNPSNKENGGIFSHTQSWAVLAEILRGRGDQAYAYYRAYLPAAQNDLADVRGVEPFVHCQSTHGRHSPRFGASRVPWLSGTASWSTYVATHWILGIRPEIDGLRIDPCLPAAWPGYRAERVFRGHRVRITVTNTNGLGRGDVRLTIDGTPLEGNLVPTERLRDGMHILGSIE
ncbi:MAG: N,N'-diacetylchitobiose phosphorylase [Armatimonadetes bacterium]|nr:N,N'-diacetylchitobiose phosphorylase [Armatimonadota bacterium]